MEDGKMIGKERVMRLLENKSAQFSSSHFATKLAGRVYNGLLILHVPCYHVSLPQSSGSNSCKVHVLCIC